MNLDAIRERADRAAQTRGGEHVTWSLACIASAADVPALLDYIASLRAALGEERAAHAQTHATLNVRTGQLTAARRHADAYEAQVRRLTDQLLTQSGAGNG